MTLSASNTWNASYWALEISEWKLHHQQLSSLINHDSILGISNISILTYPHLRAKTLWTIAVKDFHNKAPTFNKKYGSKEILTWQYVSYQNNQIG